MTNPTPNELEALKAELEAVKKQRDDYFRELSAMLSQEISFTEEELKDLEKNGVTMSEAIRLLEAKHGPAAEETPHGKS